MFLRSARIVYEPGSLYTKGQIAYLLFCRQHNLSRSNCKVSCNISMDRNITSIFEILDNDCRTPRITADSTSIISAIDNGFRIPPRYRKYTLGFALHYVPGNVGYLLCARIRHDLTAVENVGCSPSRCSYVEH